MFSAVQGEFKANSAVVALYLRKYTEQTSTERNAKFQADVPQHRRRILKHQLQVTAVGLIRSSQRSKNSGSSAKISKNVPSSANSKIN